MPPIDPNSPIGPNFAQQQDQSVPTSLLQLLGGAAGGAPIMGNQVQTHFGAGGDWSGTGLPAWGDQANWGAAPKLADNPQGGQQGWFPNVFAHGGNDPNGKFWTMNDYLGQPPGAGLNGGDMPNTLNWHLLGPGAQPGDFMYMGHIISQSKLNQDFRQGQEPAGGTEGGSNWPPIRRLPPSGLGNLTGAFFYGGAPRYGFPGQLDPWGVQNDWQ